MGQPDNGAQPDPEDDKECDENAQRDGIVRPRRQSVN